MRYVGISNLLHASYLTAKVRPKGDVPTQAVLNHCLGDG